MITLKTLPKAAAQEVFNQVYIHLINQNVASLSKGQGCAYRGINDTKCAVGCLMSNTEYQDIFSEKSEDDTSDTSWNGMVTKFDLTNAHFDLLEELQRIHDSSAPNYWPSELSILATKNNFIVPTIIA